MENINNLLTMSKEVVEAKKKEIKKTKGNNVKKSIKKDKEMIAKTIQELEYAKTQPTEEELQVIEQRFINFIEKSKEEIDKMSLSQDTVEDPNVIIENATNRIVDVFFGVDNSIKGEIDDNIKYTILKRIAPIAGAQIHKIQNLITEKHLYEWISIMSNIHVTAIDNLQREIALNGYSIHKNNIQSDKQSYFKFELIEPYEMESMVRDLKTNIMLPSNKEYKSVFIRELTTAQSMALEEYSLFGEIASSGARNSQDPYILSSELIKDPKFMKSLLILNDKVKIFYNEDYIHIPSSVIYDMFPENSFFLGIIFAYTSAIGVFAKYRHKQRLTSLISSPEEKAL